MHWILSKNVPGKQEHDLVLSSKLNPALHDVHSVFVGPVHFSHNGSQGLQLYVLISKNVPALQMHLLLTKSYSGVQDKQVFSAAPVQVKQILLHFVQADLASSKKNPGLQSHFVPF